MPKPDVLQKNTFASGTGHAPDTAERKGGMQPTEWNVITGAPSSGKTAVIEALHRRGYQVVPEAARAFINREMARGKTLHQVKSDIHWFERTILMEKIRIESQLPADKVVFLDRAIPDSIAYYVLENLDPTEAIVEACRRRYRRIFMFERLKIKADGVRSEDDRKARRIDALLQDAYQNLGYPIFRVPALPLAERTDWIVARL